MSANKQRNLCLMSTENEKKLRRLFIVLVQSFPARRRDKGMDSGNDFKIDLSLLESI